MRIPPAADAAHSHQVVGGKAQQRLARDLGLTDQFGLGQTTHRLDPAKGLFDTLAHPQALLVALVAASCVRQWQSVCPWPPHGV